MGAKDASHEDQVRIAIMRRVLAILMRSTQIPAIVFYATVLIFGILLNRRKQHYTPVQQNLVSKAHTS